MKEDAVVNKQLLQDSGMHDVSYVRYSEKSLMKIYRAFMEKKSWCPLLGGTTWPLETNRQTFKTSKHTLSQNEEPLQSKNLYKWRCLSVLILHKSKYSKELIIL